MPTKRLVFAFLILGFILVARVALPLILAADSSQKAVPADIAVATTKKALESTFTSKVQPFFERYCFGCHGSKKPAASLNLRQELSMAAIARDAQQWERVLERLHAEEMPPEDAPRQPDAAERAAVIAWINAVRDDEAERHAGDPGTVLARRLSNAEFDYTIRDLTGVDIRPTREFPVDPANQAGFDNSGESLTMSPALLKRYLGAARLVADHLVLKPTGFVFAPHPVVTDTDRDKYCVARIIDFYDRHKVDYADYFLAAQRYRQRVKLGHADATMASIAAEAGLSATYLAIVWAALNDNSEQIGPLAVVRKKWNELRASEVPPGRRDLLEMRDLVLKMRKQLKPDGKRLKAPGISPGSQPLILWRDRQLASQHGKYAGDVLTDMRKLGELFPGDPALFPGKAGDKQSEKALRTSLQRFCATFPDTFVVSDRGGYFETNGAGKGRLLTAGFHLMQGYFRDDAPLCSLILTDAERRELDSLWSELNFITTVPMRQYHDFIFFERAEPPRFMIDADFDFARSEDMDCTSAAKMTRLAKAYLAKARMNEASEEAIQAIEAYFTNMSATIRQVERAHLAAEPSHLDALLRFAERAYRRPLVAKEREQLLAFYHKLRKDDDLGHADALADTLVSILMSPHFCYRLDLPADAGKGGIRALSDYALANRLSYFLWSSMPDAELLAHAAAGDLHKPDVFTAQARRLLRDPRVRGLATEFASNWLDCRRFEEHNAVDRERFPSFTNDLRQAMFEEPIRYFVDLAQRNRSVLDLLYGKDTFVNSVLAKHYGMPHAVPPLMKGGSGGGLAKDARDAKGPARQAGPTNPSPPYEGGARGGWVHVNDADRYGRGGLLPMAVFLTKNAPGLRTSPVKRGYWVVRRLLGETIPPPPPTVPELPRDEANLGQLTLAQLLARHRADKACAGCHRRFDAVGLVFEDFGPIGERRDKDLSDHPVQTNAVFPDGAERDGLAGLRDYIRTKRQGDFVDNLCKKLLSYALGRTLLLSDKKTLTSMKTRLTKDGYKFGSMVEVIVTSPQFLNARVSDGRD